MMTFLKDVKKPFLSLIVIYYILNKSTQKGNKTVKRQLNLLCTLALKCDISNVQNDYTYSIIHPLTICFSVYMSVCLPACLPACLPVCIPACLPGTPVPNKNKR